MGAGLVLGSPLYAHLLLSIHGCVGAQLTTLRKAYSPTYCAAVPLYLLPMPGVQHPV